ncbi:OmpA/MotB domain-containing protein [Desulfatibacillum aliphaticivorans]|uniref:OmpA/MotB domain-containing protein n=1 Tax=Desulfatibacillum aliphaticivorans TaxID=218208 RepID=B8FK40_DESAL|nr:flagellar motor protein MotB [Desulfatibacillum aliphaticivorans]ACL02715.1 OmpA/MotB domain-containing protein [Desulfatibacillum aliphaticivorans]
MGKQPKEIESPDTTMWMVTFADLVTLLMTFFVLLLTMSSMDTKALQTMFTLFAGASGPLDFSPYGKVSPMQGDADMTPGPLDGMSPDNVDMLTTLTEILDNSDYIKEPEAILKRLTVRSRDVVKQLTERYTDQIYVNEDERGVVLTFDETVMFDPGSSRIRPEIYPLLDVLAQVLKAVSGRVLIIGHSDSTPMHSVQYDSNWDLSLSRALNVLYYFTTEHDLSEDRLGVGGMGNTKPIASNKTQAGRDKNRRVEIVITK